MQRPGRRQDQSSRRTEGPWEQQGAWIRATVRNQSARIQRFTGHGACGLVAGSSTAERQGFVIWSTCRTAGPPRLMRAVSARWALAIAEADGLTHEGGQRKPHWSACPLEELQHGE